MIQAKLRRNQKIKSIMLTGHALSGEYGQDIVCAGVSALAINTFNSIEELVKVNIICEIDEDNGGYFYLEVIDNPDYSEHQLAMEQLILESFWLGLQSIEQEYPEHLNLLEEEAL